MGILEGVLVGVIILLTVTLLFEAAQYKKFLVAQRGLMAMAAGVQEGFNTVVEHMNRLSAENLGLKQDFALSEQELTAIRTVLDVHSSYLEMTQFKKIFVAIDKLKAGESS